jgi:RNA polymerase sigma factor (sigma-70 family)
MLRRVRTLFDVGAVAGLSDGQLLERFVSGRGEVAELAFAVLLERHGPMVLRVCRKVLRDRHDADDAFQATFLVLVRRAGSIRRRDSVACWLHGVALRVAACARAAAMRRRAHEARRGTEMGGREIVEDPGRGDLGPALHEEIERLPNRFREAAVLCLLEGRSVDEAALRLGCPAGTIKSRLSAARERLRRRLARKGLTPSVGLFAAALAEEAEAAATTVPAALAEATTRAATRIAAAKAAAAGAVPASVATLTQGVLKAMFLSKLKLVAAASVALGVLSYGALAWAQFSGQQTVDDGDRLRSMERKLDRLIEVLERTPRTAQDPFQAPPPATTLTTTQPAPITGTPAATPRESGVTLTYPGFSGVAPAPAVAATPGVPGMTYSRSTTRLDAPGELDERLGRVENRLESLEKRLDRLEKQLRERPAGEVEKTERIPH